MTNEERAVLIAAMVEIAAKFPEGERPSIEFVLSKGRQDFLRAIGIQARVVVDGNPPFVIESATRYADVKVHAQTYRDATAEEIAKLNESEVEERRQRPAVWLPADPAPAEGR